MPPPADNCRIELNGSFDLSWADYVSHMQVHEQVAQGTVRRTILVGHPGDLEACLGLLHLLVDRGFPVVAFEYRQVGAETVNGTSGVSDSAG